MYKTSLYAKPKIVSGYINDVISSLVYLNKKSYSSQVWISLRY